MLEAAELAARVGVFRVSPQGDPVRRTWAWLNVKFGPSQDARSS
jgi:hypothetical protein